MTRLDFAAVNAAARAAIPRLIAAWVPEGRRHGREWVGRNPRRADRHPGSFSINLDSGRWSDFATGDAGGDFVSLFAFLHGLGQGEAARNLAQELGLDQNETVADVASVAGHSGKNEGRRTNDAGWRALLPVPADAPALTDGAVGRFAPSRAFSPRRSYRYTSAAGDWLGFGRPLRPQGQRCRGSQGVPDHPVLRGSGRPARMAGPRLSRAAALVRPRRSGRPTRCAGHCRRRGEERRSRGPALPGPRRRHQPERVEERQQGGLVTPGGPARRRLA